MKRKHKSNCDDLIWDFMERYHRRWLERQSDLEDASNSEKNGSKQDAAKRPHPSDNDRAEEKKA